MLKTLSIRNFQAHKESNLTFHEGVNVITGTSDSGKTATLRSLNWLVNNRPSGDAFKNWDAPLKEPVTVQLELEDGFCVELERQNGKNVYSIYDRDGNQSVFSAIKTDVPVEVTKLLNLSEYNTQSQHQSYFLLQDTPGEIAKKLNELVGLSVIDTLYSNLAGRIRQTSTQIAILISSRDNTERDLDQYKKLDEVGTIIDTLEKLHAETAGATSSLNQIEEKLSTLVEIKEKRKELLPLVTLSPDVEEINGLISGVVAKTEWVSNLNRLIKSLNSLQQDIDTDKAWLELEPFHTELTKKLEEVSGMKEKVDGLDRIISTGSNISRTMQMEQTSEKKLVDEYVSLMKESSLCPTCGTKIDSKKLSEIERNLNG